MLSIVKTKVDNLIGYELSNKNVLVTNAWRGLRIICKVSKVFRFHPKDGRHVIKGLYHIQNVMFFSDIWNFIFGKNA